MSCCPPTSKKCKRSCRKTSGNKSRDCDCSDCSGRSSRHDRDPAGRRDRSCPPRPCPPACPDRSDVATDVAYIYTDEATDPIADGAQLTLATTGPSSAGITINEPLEEDGEPVPGSGTTVEVCNTGLYDFWYSVRGTTPFGEGGQAPAQVYLALGSDPSDLTEIDGTRYAGGGSSVGDGTQSIVGFGTILLAKGDRLSLVNATGEDLTLADDGAVAASLKIELTESRPDCCE